jgi:DNA-binding transcriptional regulator GbsR (MarR family)
MSPEEAEFVDRVGLFMEMLGGPRTMGRVYGWLLICDPPQQSLTEMAQALSVSKASVSTVARQLQDGGMIERLPTATRQHVYRVTPGGFSSVLSVQLSRMKLGIDVADFGLSLLGEDRAEQRERLEDFRDELMQRWLDYRGERRKR